MTMSISRDKRKYGQPVFEPIVPSATESFVWRRDDYPLSWSVWNAHPECEIHLIRNAEGTCHVGDHVGSFTDGDLYFVGSGLPHNWVTPIDRNGRIEGRDVIVQFDEDQILKASGVMPELNALEPFFMKARRGFVFSGNARRTGGELIEAIGRGKGVERLSLFFRLLHLLSTTSERRLLSSETFVPNADVSGHHAVREVLSWMSDHFDSDVRVALLAEMVGMTETSFSRFFKRNTGTTFSRYLSELRMAKACDLLVRSDMPVTRIAHEVGYDNLSNFNRTFRLLRGIPPSRYRQARLATG